MQNTHKISVIVPVYKVEAYLPACIESLTGQTYSNLQIILVDDGSPDQCGNICDAYAERDTRIQVIHKQNGGLSSARNAGIDAASGDYLAFCDSDDTMVPDALESMLSCALTNDVPMVCAGRFDVDEATGVRTPGLCPESDEVVSAEVLVRKIFTWDHMDSAAWDKLYRADLFEGIRYPVGKIVEDVPTTYRIALRAGRVALLAKPVYCYLHRANSITTSAVSEKTFHFTEHAHAVYEDICSSCPSVKPEAEYLKASSLFLTVEAFDHAQSELFRERVHSCRTELRSELPFIFSCRYFTPREKLLIVLLAFDRYRGMLSLKRRMTGRA